MDDLFVEAERQLNICNSCRYCEGYCPVWPTLETMTELSEDGLKHLSNLCHDCRDCFSACMYTAPHEFALNPPALFSAVRQEIYREYTCRPGRAGHAARGESPRSPSRSSSSSLPWRHCCTATPRRPGR